MNIALPSGSLSHRIRPGAEAAPWVCDAVLSLERSFVATQLRATTLTQALSQLRSSLNPDIQIGDVPVGTFIQNALDAEDVKAAAQPELPTDIIRVACITLDGSTLTVPLADFEGVIADLLGDEDESYTMRLKSMTRAAFDALGEFDGF
jgi:hypothetical protein